MLVLMSALVQALWSTWPSTLPAQCRFWELRRLSSGRPHPSDASVSVEHLFYLAGWSDLISFTLRRAGSLCSLLSNLHGLVQF